MTDGDEQDIAKRLVRIERKLDSQHADMDKRVTALEAGYVELAACATPDQLRQTVREELEGYRAVRDKQLSDLIRKTVNEDKLAADAENWRNVKADLRSVGVKVATGIVSLILVGMLIIALQAGLRP